VSRKSGNPARYCLKLGSGLAITYIRLGAFRSLFKQLIFAVYFPQKHSLTIHIKSYSAALKRLCKHLKSYILAGLDPTQMMVNDYSGRRLFGLTIIWVDNYLGWWLFGLTNIWGWWMFGSTIIRVDDYSGQQLFGSTINEVDDYSGRQMFG
jgi:hypothetical protein